MSELRQLARGAPGAEWRRIVDVPNPGAGVDVNLPVTAKKAWRLLSVSCTFVAAAAAGNRAIALSLRDADNVPLVEVPIATAITTGQTRTIGWSVGLGASLVGAATALALPLPNPWYMLPGESLAIVGHTNAGDAFSLVRVVVIETNTGDVVHERNMQQSILDHYEAIHDLIELGRQ